MQAERDHLVRFVFPKLREDLLRKRVRLIDVDLRWGVTSDQDAVELCKHEIDRCRPRFVCMLGGRYGWVPPPPAVAQDFMDRLRDGMSAAGELTDAEQGALGHLYSLDAARKRYSLRNRPRAGADVGAWEHHCEVAVDLLQRTGIPEAARSITASEVDYGALERLDEPVFRYFYFRQAAVTEAITDPRYREVLGSFADTALSELKERVRSSEGLMLVAPGQVARVKLPVYEYPCSWDEATKRVTSLHEFGERVRANLVASIDAEFGAGLSDELDWFEAQDSALEAFVDTRTERYVVGSRQPVFDALVQHAEGTDGNGYVCVLGEPGSGKSALLAKFYREYMGSEDRSDHPLVVAHFVGVNATNVRQVLRRICQKLADGAGIPGEVPVDYETLQRVFPDFLRHAAQQRRVVIIVDGLNNLDRERGEPPLTWLPRRLPEGARVIVSAIDGVPIAEPPSEVTLQPLTPGDANSIIDSFLERYCKRLDDTQRTALLAKSDVARAGSPLYLVTALEELRTLGIYKEITERIREMPGEIQPLFNWILDRLERDDGLRDDTGQLVGEQLVRTYCSRLSLGRLGMAESELVELAAPGDPQGNVAALHALLRPYLMNRGELLDFFHLQLTDAVQRRYLATDDERIRVHRDIAVYFQAKADPFQNWTWAGDYRRGEAELLYHIENGEMWSDLLAAIGDVRILKNLTREEGGRYGIERHLRSCTEALEREGFSSPRMARMSQSLTWLAACLELHYIDGAGGFDPAARCRECGEQAIVHGHIELGGSGSDYFDHYFAWCTSCFWCWLWEHVDMSGDVPEPFDYKTNTY